MSQAARLLHQSRFDLLVFRRNPAATFFTVIFPLIFLVIFTSIFGDQELENGVRADTRYVPGILAMAVISATLANLAMTTVTRRERGILKRLRATPLSPLTFILSQGAAAVAISLFMTILVVAIGRLVFGVAVRSEGIVPLIITVLIGAVSFSAMGLALTAIIPSESAAPAITNAVVLPLYFISDVFTQGDKPTFMTQIAEIFPVQHLALALQESFKPESQTMLWPVGSWVAIAIWGAIGAAVAATKFRWMPSR